MSLSPSVVWLRSELRLEDNPALVTAVEQDPAVRRSKPRREVST